MEETRGPQVLRLGVLAHGALLHVVIDAAHARRRACAHTGAATPECPHHAVVEVANELRLQGGVDADPNAVVVMDDALAQLEALLARVSCRSWLPPRSI